MKPHRCHDCSRLDTVACEGNGKPCAERHHLCLITFMQALCPPTLGTGLGRPAGRRSNHQYQATPNFSRDLFGRRKERNDTDR